MKRGSIYSIYRIKIYNKEIQRQTKVRDVGHRIKDLNWNWAGHLARLGEGH